MNMKEAVQEARLKLGLSRHTPASVVPVRMIDERHTIYQLIMFGPPEAVVGVAAADLETGKIMMWANSAGILPHLTYDEAKAKKAVNFPPASSASLVWKSCKASRSLLYPIWEIIWENKIVYLDQQGYVWQILE